MTLALIGSQLKQQFLDLLDYFDQFPNFENWLNKVHKKCKLINSYGHIKWNLNKRYLH